MMQGNLKELNLTGRSFITYITFLFLLGCLHSLYGQETTCDDDVPSRPVPRLPGVSPKTEIQPTVCAEGTYVHLYECRPCEDGTFMTRKMSEQREHTRCLKCYEPGMYEIVEEPCTKTRDAKIMCEDGYYRSQLPGKPCQSECRRCDVCGLGINMYKNYKSRECSDDQNTVCCPNEGFVVVINECIDGTNAPEKSFSTSSTPKSLSTAPVVHSAGPKDNAVTQCSANLPMWIVIIVTYCVVL